MAEAQRKTSSKTVSKVPTTAMIVDFALRSRVPADAIALARSALLDSLAVTIAGGREPSVMRLAASLPTAAAQGVGSFWSHVQYREEDAALLFGMASHILDYDDVSMLSVCHPSVPVLGALLAGADREAIGGQSFLEALAIGTEVLIRLGEAMGFEHYRLGFHATSTLGTVGAAAALARICRLDDDQTVHALAIACSLSCGIRVNFGTNIKSLHVGFAATNALKAVRLAQAGLIGATEPLEGPAGFLHAFTGGEVSAWPDAVRLGQPFAISDPGFEQKRYPCCYMLHKMIEATLGLRLDTGLDLGSIQSARVIVAKGGASALIHPFPKNSLNALFSAPYAICASLADGRIDLASFTEEAVLRPHIQRRLQDVEVVERVGVVEDVGNAPVEVTLVPRTGPSVSKTVQVSPGSLNDPITSDQARAKWADCLARGTWGALSPEIADALYIEGQAIESAAAIGGWLRRLASAVANSVPA